MSVFQNFDIFLKRTKGELLINSSDIETTLPQISEIQKGVLYLVSTPIGNLGDITLRALHTLKSVDLVFCEDTRISNRLLKAYQIKASLHVYNDHSTSRERQKILKALEDNKSVALISDAGTPLISDPGYKLVSACQEADIPITLVPGPTALIHGLVISGLPTNQFYFGGFLPLKLKDRQEKLGLLTNLSATLIFYETGPKLLKTLEEFNMIFKERVLVLGRELTKKFEQIHKGLVSDLLSYYTKNGPPKGEIVLILEGQKKEGSSTSINPEICKALLEKMSIKDATDFLSKFLKYSRNTAYKSLLDIKNEDL